MQKGLSEIFKKAYYSPGSELSGTVYHTIVAREARISLLKFYGYGSLGLLSLASLIPVGKNLLQEFTQSGFYEYLSLAFSDGGSISSHWKEFVLSLADSLPTTSILLSLALIFVFCVSVRRTAHQFKNQLSVV